MRAWASTVWWPARFTALHAAANARQALPHTLRTRQQYNHTHTHTSRHTPTHTLIHTYTGNVKRSLTAIETPSAGNGPKFSFQTQSCTTHSLLHSFTSLESFIFSLSLSFILSLSHSLSVCLSIHSFFILRYTLHGGTSIAFLAAIFFYSSTLWLFIRFLFTCPHYMSFQPTASH